jgi:mono/diheme cytochrome c family protein
MVINMKVENILVKMAKRTVLLAMTLVFFSGLISTVKAASKTGLESSLIKEWHSEVDRSKCKDFRYPSYEPSIATGEGVYKANCAKCHGASPSASVEAFRKTSPEKQFEFVCGGDPKGAHKFASTLTIDERWDSLIYMRSNVLGYFKDGSPELAEMDALFGGNCAVCHGTRGQGDGNLHKSLLPPPANFKMFKRLYTRSDDKLFNEVAHGIPWTAMPAWYNRHDFDKGQTFDQELIWKLVRYVRQFSSNQSIDRLDEGKAKLGAYKAKLGEK